MLKDKTWKKSTSNRISIDELGFMTELNSQQAELASGGIDGYGIAGYWGYNLLPGQYEYVTVDHGSVPLAGYPTGPIDPRGWMLNQEARDIYSGLQGIFTHLPSIF